MAGSSILIWYASFALFLLFVVSVGVALIFWGQRRQRRRRKNLQEKAKLDPLQPDD